MILSAHQPNHLPWLPWFRKVADADVFVLLDDAPYSSGGYLNRQRIPGPSGPRWLTVPLVKAPLNTPINERQPVPGWQDRWWALLTSAYRDHPWWALYCDDIAAAIRGPWDLADVNMRLIRLLLDWLDIHTPIAVASGHCPTGTGADRILAICRHFDADCYLAGPRSRDYLDVKRFASIGVTVEVRDPSPQRYLSALDLVMREGPDAAAVFRGDR